MSGNPENLAKLCIDVVIIALIGISAVMGWRKGLASVVFSCFRWLICIGGAVLASYPVKWFLKEQTGIDEAIMTHVKTTMTSSITGSSFFIAVPEQLKGTFSTYEQTATYKVANTMSETLISVLAFLLSFIVLILITKLFSFALTHRRKRGPIGFFNGFLGACFGVLRGVFIISILMLALFPLLSFADPRAASPIVSGIRQSTLAQLFYDNNPITMLFQMF